MNRTGQKITSTLGMLTIGDSMAYLISPKRHTKVWSFKREPKWYRKTMKGFSRRTASCRMLGATGLAMGIGLVLAAQRSAR